MGTVRALIIEDDRSSLLEIVEFLAKRGVETKGVETILEGMKFLQLGGPIDLVVSAYTLPDGFGDQILAAARKLYPAAKIVSLSSMRQAEEDVLPYVKKAGTDLFLRKPLKAKDFESLLK